MPFVTSTEMFKTHLLNPFAYKREFCTIVRILHTIFSFTMRSLKLLKALGLHSTFVLLALSIHTQNFNTTLSSLEFQQNPKTKTLGEVQKCVDSNTFPSFTQFSFLFYHVGLDFKLCIVFYFLPRHGVPTSLFKTLWIFLMVFVISQPILLNQCFLGLHFIFKNS